MKFQLNSFKDQLRENTATIALLFLEDAFWADLTVHNLLENGFDQIFVFGTDQNDLQELVDNVSFFEVAEMHNRAAVEILNAAIPALKNRWVFYCFNGEFLHFPFDETRKINDFCSFVDEERRKVVSTNRIDLYPSDKAVFDSSLPLSDLNFDKVGYFSQNREDALGNPKSQQIDIGGGFRWRMMDHLPEKSFWINRSQIFKPVAGLKMNGDFKFNLDVYETVQSIWHHSPSAVVGSIRAYRYLLDKIGKSDLLEKLEFQGSEKYQNCGQQFMDLGLMEPGQWF